MSAVAVMGKLSFNKVAHARGGDESGLGAGTEGSVEKKMPGVLVAVALRR